MPSAKYSWSGSLDKLERAGRRLTAEVRSIGQRGFPALPRSRLEAPRQITSAHCIDTHRACNILDAPLSQIIERVGQPGADLIEHRAGDANPAGLGQGFEPRRDVDAV